MILWVLVVHISLNGGVCQYGEAFTYRSPFCWLSFYMATFYFFSGHLLRRNRSPYETLVHGVKSLLLPHAAMSAFGLAIYVMAAVARGKGVDFGMPFRGALETACLRTNTPCWFFISLFFVKVLHSLAFRLLHGVIGTSLLSILLVLIGWKTCNWPQFLGYGNICIGFFFYHLGLLSKRVSALPCELRIILASAPTYLAIPLVAPLGLWFSRNVKTSAFTSAYMLDILFSVAACFLLLSIAKHAPYDCEIVGWTGFIGRHSLVFFGLHQPILNYLFDPAYRHFFATTGFFEYFVSALLFLLLVCSGTIVGRKAAGSIAKPREEAA